MTTPTISPSAVADRDEVAQATTTRYTAVRIVFGLVWALDATLKWLPGFREQFGGMVRDSAQGQPAWLHPWFSFWVHLVSHAPTTLAILVALAETAIAVSVVFGVLQRVGWAFGTVFALLIWGIGEGFGGPYVSGATDIGSAIMYAVIFVALWAAVPSAVRARAAGLDRTLSRVPALRWATFH